MVVYLKNEFDFSNDILAKQNNEKSSLKKTTNILSFLCVISFALNYILSITAKYLGFLKTKDLLFVSLGVITVCAVLMPFIIASHFLGETKALISHKNKSKNKPIDVFLMIVFGFGACMTVNILTVFLSALFPILGGTNSVQSYGNDTGTIISMLIVFAILPAICEEFVFRGIVMGSLRKYGDKIAIVISALLFALLHQSLSTMIFAFCSGVILGIIRKSSDSLIPSMIVHFLNNALGAMMSVLSSVMSDESYVLSYYIVVSILVFAGLLSLILLNKRNIGIFEFSAEESVLTEREKFKTALKSVFLYCVIFIAVAFVLMAILF